MPMSPESEKHLKEATPVVAVLVKALVVLINAAPFILCIVLGVRWLMTGPAHCIQIDHSGMP